MSARSLITRSLLRAGYSYSPMEDAKPYLEPTPAQREARHWRRDERKRVTLADRIRRYRDDIARHQAAMRADPDFTDLCMRRIASAKLGPRLAISAQMVEPRPDLPDLCRIYPFKAAAE